VAKLNPLMAAQWSEPRDFTDRLRRIRPTVDNADPGMVVQPPVDPGYMPNIDTGDVVQMPVVEGWLPAGGAAPQHLMDNDVNRQPETGFLPRYGRIPTEPPENTYTGVIPTPRSDYGPTILQLPHDYMRMNKLLQPGDPASWQLLLKTMLMNRASRRA
jgi:hypothetical protein